MVSSIYDPLGFLHHSPFTLPVKQLLQKMCKYSFGWDEKIPQVFFEQWTRWLTNLHHIATLEIDRCVKPNDFGPSEHAQLHHFSDASEGGYGTVSYLRLVNSGKMTTVAFMLGKSELLL